MARDEFSQPPEWVADLLAAVLSARGRGIDAADAAWDFLRTRGVIHHVEGRSSGMLSLHPCASETSNPVLVLGAERNARA